MAAPVSSTAVGTAASVSAPAPTSSAADGKQSAAKPVPVLGYWKIRGLAQPIRNVLEYAGEAYENRLFEQGDPPGYSREAWTGVKYKLDLDFANLPFWIEGNLKLTQSDAILNYVGRKHGLCGKTPEESAVIDMVLGQAYDVRSALTSMCYSQRFHELKASHFKNTFPGQLQELHAFLAKQQKQATVKAGAAAAAAGDDVAASGWFAGALSIADFVLYETFDLARTIDSACLEGAAGAAVQEFMKRFEALPPLKKYFASPRYFARPFNNKSALFK